MNVRSGYDFWVPASLQVVHSVIRPEVALSHTKATLSKTFSTTV
jgi:hypothetical protein